MTYNIYTGANYTLDQEETIKKVISNRPDWGLDLFQCFCFVLVCLASSWWGLQ